MKVVITGPRSAGKTRVSKIVARRQGLVYISSDMILDEALSQYGGLHGAIQDGRTGLIAREGSSVIDDVLQRDGVVFDLAGGSLTNQPSNPGESAWYESLLDDDVLVIGLAPCDDVEEAADVITRREKQRRENDMLEDEHEARVREHCEAFFEVADRVVDTMVYQEDDSFEALAERVIAVISDQS